ncbi:ABC transporter ATP-binding protein [Streptomyces lonarensis]|uniref:ABC transporter ATP-binding protein n=1 Tax=Streptomyces lonarensis TaxID=700599 RepID=A0A7X6I1B4_9ACTN|nr:ABC transporter ATP-binding protein [Streptomyces lonarensis]NJQ08370.1 ABC transporter ATP-binding protein [Streptomyces lonarensis]
MTEHVIEVTGLRRRYGGGGSAAGAKKKGTGIAGAALGRKRGGDDGKGFEAVRGLDFSVRRGEVFALLGTNGAGKTSTVEVLEGLAAPTAGTVSVLGMDPLTDRAAVRPRIGIMLQEGGFPSDLTVTETARMWSGCVSEPRPIQEALEMVDMEDRASTRVKMLSGGERRRLDLAMALLGYPEVLFLDEPTTGLDPEARQQTWALIRRLRDSGTSIMLTTHYLDEAEKLADRLAIMHEGRIVHAGTPAEVTAAQPSRITFRLPAGVAPAHLPVTLRAAEYVDRIEIRTQNLQDDLAELLLWARQNGVVLDQLNARTASLEEAFLDIARQQPQYEGAL